jgi:hypothetical protein
MFAFCLPEVTWVPRNRHGGRSFTTVSQALFGKGSARCRLQILLKSEGLFLVGECDVGLHRPRRLFRRVRYLACVVLLESLAQIACNSDVEMLGIFYAVQDVYVSHERTRAACCLACRAVAGALYSPPSPFGSGAAAFSRLARAKVGGAEGIRTLDLLDAIEARSQLRHGPTLQKTAESLPCFSSISCKANRRGATVSLIFLVPWRPPCVLPKER